MKPDFKPNADQINATKVFVQATALRQTIEPVLLKIQADLLEKYRYRYEDRYPDRYPELEEYIKEPKHKYMMSEADLGHFCTEYHARFTAAGFRVDKFGQCPLLVAESLESDARRLLITAMQPVSGLSFDDFFRGPKWKEHMETFTDLTLRFLVQYF